MVALSPQHLETQHLPELSLCILTWIIPHGLNVTNATPQFMFSVGRGNPCRLSEINISYAHSFVADSFRPFSVCVLLALPVPLDVCSFRLFRLCYVLFALKMARKKVCPSTPGKKKSPQRGRSSGRSVGSWNLLLSTASDTARHNHICGDFFFQIPSNTFYKG